MPPALDGVDLRGIGEWIGGEWVHPRKGTKRPPGFSRTFWAKCLSHKERLKMTAKYEASLKHPVPSALAAPTIVPKRRVVEICADENSDMYNKKYNTDKCECIRITKEDDLLTLKGFNKGMGAVNIFPRSTRSHIVAMHRRL